MPSLSGTIEQANGILNKVLETVWDDFGSLNPMLSEPARQRFVAEEQSLRERLKEAEKPKSSSWGISSILTGWRSSQSGKYVEEAEDLHARVRDEINEEMRRRATEGIPSTSLFDFIGAGTARSPVANETSELNEPVFSDRHSPAISSPCHSDSDGRSTSPSFEGSSRPSTNGSSPSQMAPDPIFPTAQDANRFTPPMAGQEWQESEWDDEPVTMTNCVSINGSSADGMTVHNGGTQNSGAVIDVTMAPRAPHHASPL